MNPAGAGRLFITTDAVGGVWHYSLAFAQGMATRGYDCILAVLGPAPDAAQSETVARIGGCTLLHTGLPLDWTVGNARGVDTLIVKLIDLAASTGAISAHLHAPALASHTWPMNIVAVAHSCMATWWAAVCGGPPPDDFAWHAAATAEGLGRADALVAPSKSFALALRETYGIGRQISVVRNGSPEPSQGQVPREAFVLAAGRLWDPAKNMVVLDAAAAVLQTPVVGVGDDRGPDGSPIVFDHLRHVGRLPSLDLHRLMARAAVFAAPSLYEPFGLAVLEAAQLGTPLVLADIPTFRELWSGAATFVPAGDPIAWAATLASLLADDRRRHSFGKAARQRSREYTQEAMIAATAALHEAPRPCSHLAA